MVYATPKSKHNSTSISKNPKNVFPIGGIQVEFPYQPYGSQLAFMSRVISTLDRGQRDGHCHALLESPTGTGKSLSLLCSALAWQQNYKPNNQSAELSHSKPAPEATTDPLGHGGGFVPETQPLSIPPSGNPEPGQSSANKTQKKKLKPTIYYATRTHSQISQVIREYRKTSYRVSMAILASRKHYCTNPYVCGKDNLDEECKLLLKNKDVGCSEFKNAHKVKGHPSLQKGGCHEVHDIEDLVKVGQVVKGCSYYAARSMSDDAQLVFCPYNYIINPVIRGAMDVDIKESIVIFDEAHNIEDIARHAGSVDLEEDVLLKLQTELDQLCSENPMIYQPLSEMIQELISWIGRKTSSLEKREFQHYFSCWTGDKALRELQEADISQQCFPILLDCATKAIKTATDPEWEGPHLSGMAVITLEGLFSSLTYFFSRNGSHILDYQLALQRYIKKDAKNSFGSVTHCISLWCLNPSVVFRDIADLTLSTILTSGTLSPLNSFSSELGVQFGTCLEAPHVIDVESQVWAGVIATGPGNYPLNASYKTADAYAFQDALGKSVEEICKVVPGGSLVFFPSYKLMEKLCSRWRETGQWSRLNLRKSIFVEPRGGSQEEFEPVLKGYYKSISLADKLASGKKTRVKKTIVDALNCQKNTKKDGAAFLAVCRGKVSEGIDFSDDNARVVIVVGIPFPNMNDTQVGLKKKYNDMYKSSKNLLSGNEWYCQQAFRALNQAAGRCIRHRFDYGAIILLDERYREERNKTYISKWLRNSIKQYDDFNESIEGLQSFFRDVKDRVGKKLLDLQDCNIIEENTPLLDKTKGPARKNQKQDKSDTSGPKDRVGQNCIEDFMFTPSTNQSKRSSKQKNQKPNNFDHSGQKEPVVAKYGFDIQSPIQIDADIKSTNYINHSCNTENKLGCCKILSRTLSNTDTEISTVEETPDMMCGTPTVSPHSVSRNGISTSTIIQTSAESPTQSLFCSASVTNLSESHKAESSMIVTPEKDTAVKSSDLTTELESSFNFSVNSHFQKKRKSMRIPFIDLVQDEKSVIPSAQTSGCINFTRRIEFSFESDCLERKNKFNVPLSLGVDNSNASGLMDMRLQISCSLCRSPLGLPQNHLYVPCLSTSSSKMHILSLLKERCEPEELKGASVSVVMTDLSSVNQQLCHRNLEGATGQGIWCEQDGCVFNNVYCPFCSIPNRCLGVQIMATDSSNVQLLNKILFYNERLEIKHLQAAKDNESMQKDLLPDNITAVSNQVEKCSPPPTQHDTGGWRTTKSKLRLPKKTHPDGER